MRYFIRKRVLRYFLECTITNVDYPKLTAVLTAGLQELYGMFTKLAEKVSGFAERFVTKEVVTDRLCIADKSGDATCLTKSEIDELLQQTDVQASQDPSIEESGTQDAGAGTSTDRIAATTTETNSGNTNEHTTTTEADGGNATGTSLLENAKDGDSAASETKGAEETEETEGSKEPVSSEVPEDTGKREEENKDKDKKTGGTESTLEEIDDPAATSSNVTAI